jgi:DNA-binding MarR family transcriptional regulator
METRDSQGLIGLATRLSKTIVRHSSEELLGIPLRAFVVLGYLHERGDVPQQELGEAMCLDANTTVLLLHDLEDDELIVRRRDPTDRRRHIIGLTEAGRNAFEQAEAGRERIEDDVFQALDPAEREALGDLIAKALTGTKQ